MAIETLTRVFRMGPVELQDPAPAEADALKAMRLYVPNYPHLAFASLSAPRYEGGKMVYEVEKAPVKTKG